jgi:uncharacterized membrane protein YtjA (UPF0391 family)
MGVPGAGFGLGGRALPGWPGPAQHNLNCFFMLYYALLFFLLAILAGAFGFFGLAGAAALIAKILFIAFLVFFIVSLVAGRRPRV